MSSGRALSSEGTGPLPSEILNDTTLLHNITFTDISPAAGTALAIVTRRETPITALLSDAADTLHLIEQAASGTMTLTTIFLKTRKDVDAGGFTYPVFCAAMSR